MTLRRWQSVLLAVVLGVLSACAVKEQMPEWRPNAPRPVAALAKTARAAYVAETSPAGGPEEARAGDVVLENGFARFVVAAAKDPARPCPPGNLIDASLQRGEDGMRLLEPLLGPEPPRRAVYTHVNIEETGGEDEPAVVAARGHLFGRAGVRVRTTYRLEPDSPMLAVKTEVENDTGSMLSLFGFRDVLYHGRTVRFVPRIGMFPAGRRGTARWMAFCAGDFAWGIAAQGPGAEMETHHLPGSSVLRYGTTDIPPGESRMYRRAVLAGYGGPPAVARILQPLEPDERARVVITVQEKENRTPVPWAGVTLRFPGASEPLVLLTDAAGRAEAEVPAGRCAIYVNAPGRPAAGPLKMGCIGGAMQLAPLDVAARSTARITVTTREQGEAQPTAGRVRRRPLRDEARGRTQGPGFPGTPWSPVALVNGLTAEVLPLPCGNELAPVPSALLASKGPLYECAYAQVQGVPGREQELQASLKRAIDPGDYRAVDFRQRTAASPDSALTVKERALINACEGLDGAVVSDCSFRDLFPDGSVPEMCVLVPGYRLDLPGLGAFSFFPVDARSAPAEGFLKAVRSGNSTADVLETIRQLFPDALVQVDEPMDEWRGLMAVEDRAPAEKFDALEILSGHDVEGAKRILPRWFRMLNRGHRVMVTGGSGSGGLLGSEAGSARTFIHCPGSGRPPDRADLVAAIRRLKSEPNAFVTNGPFVEATLEGGPPGSTRTVRSDTARLQVRVSAPGWIDVQRLKVYRNSELVEEIAVSSNGTVRRCDRSLDIGVPGDCWVVVVVEGDRSMAPVYGTREGPTPWAVTNPFWIDADGDGLVRIQAGS